MKWCSQFTKLTVRTNADNPEQTANALHQQNRIIGQSGLQAEDVLDRPIERDQASLASSGYPRCERCTIKERVDFIEAQHIVLHRAEMARVGARAGTKRLESDGVNADAPEKKNQQAREDSLANVGVGAADDCDLGAYCQFMLSTWISRGELRRRTAV